MRIYTTGEVSRICKVATTTVNKWFDSGRLEGFRVPGSRHRRIPQENLVRFLRDHGVPLGALEAEVETKVLIVSRDHELVDRLKVELSPENGTHLVCTASGFEAGIQAESVGPDCVLVDFDMGQVEALQMCHNIRQSRGLAHTVVVALLPGNSSRDLDLSEIADETFAKPLDPALLAQRARRLVRDRRRAFSN